jgi:pimeloyl-ACP methyl ester carboxylesterase
MTFPVLLLSGSNDPLCPPARHEEMARSIPDVTVTVAEACGHMVPLERPDSIKNLAGFLAISHGRRH